MLITREIDYALRILRALHQKGQLSAAAIAQGECIPRAVTVKLLKRLHASGLVLSRRGSRGGYSLRRPCEELFLGDILSALGESVCINRCQQPDYRCENRPEGDCGLCRELSRIQKVLDVELRKTPLSAIFQETSEIHQ